MNRSWGKVKSIALFRSGLSYAIYNDPVGYTAGLKISVRKVGIIILTHIWKILSIIIFGFRLYSSLKYKLYREDELFIRHNNSRLYRSWWKKNYNLLLDGKILVFFQLTYRYLSRCSILTYIQTHEWDVESSGGEIRSLDVETVEMPKSMKQKKKKKNDNNNNNKMMMIQTHAINTKTLVVVPSLIVVGNSE